MIKKIQVEKNQIFEIGIIMWKIKLRFDSDCEVFECVSDLSSPSLSKARNHAELPVWAQPERRQGGGYGFADRHGVCRSTEENWHPEHFYAYLNSL